MSEAEATGDLGLAPAEVRLAPHHPLWFAAYHEEAARIWRALGPRILAIEHFGSTAVPGLKAKPIIDLQIGVRRLNHGLALRAGMRRLGYHLVEGHGVPDHHLFANGPRPTHHAHVVEFDSDSWRRVLRFRDRLRAEPELRRAYEALKCALAADPARERRDYTAAKTEFILSASQAV